MEGGSGKGTVGGGGKGEVPYGQADRGGDSRPESLVIRAKREGEVGMRLPPVARGARLRRVDELSTQRGSKGGD